MPLIPDSEIDRIKKTTDLAALVRSRGVELRNSGGGNLIGRCPFHDDKRPSFVVTPGKGLWRCMSPACAAAGNAIQFVEKFDGISFRHAAERLLAPSAVAFTAAPKTVRVLPPPVALDADDKTLLRQVVDYYHERLVDENAGRAGRAYLQSRGLGNAEAIRAHKIGFADRTLGLRLPLKNRAAGADIRTRLEKLGIYRESGHEHFNGCVVMPIFDGAGEVAGIYGRKIVPRQSTGIYHLYLRGPHRGWWNRDALKSREVILCEALLDALTFWENGFANVTAAYGADGFTQEMEDAFVAAKLDRVFIAFDRDAAGDAGAEKVAARLMARGIECRRVLFPHGQDANEYARKITPANKALAVMLNAAAFVGRGKEGKGEVSADASKKPEASKMPEVSLRDTRAPSSLAAKAALVADATAPTPTPPKEAAKEEKPNAPALPPPTLAPAAPTPSLVLRGEHWFFETDGREYRVGGLEKTLGTDALKIALRLKHGDRFHLDALDLMKDAERRRFVERAAEETGLHVDLLKRDVSRLLLAAEQAQAELARPAEQIARAVVLSDAERDEALAFLRDPKLLDRIKADFTACGVVGEETNKLAGYLAAVSRKLARPLGIIVQSTSAAGKSALMEAVLAFVPPEERVKYSALTGQALYYMGDADLKHKVLAIVEEAGAEKASYALKLLQSDGEIAIASTGKDPHTGRMVTQEYRVEGPVMIFLTSTAVDIDEELLNRCLILTVDESREQTAAIHRMQRKAETLDGMFLAESRAQLLALHRNAQRLLRPLRVFNPFADDLTFPDERTRTRRDNPKYLALIRTVALLHQHQRAVKRAERGGRELEYIEITIDDIATANALAHEILGRCLDEMPPQTRRLLELLEKMVGERCTAAKITREDARFSRRTVREHTGWGDTQLKVHLARLVELEYVITHRAEHGQGCVYELLYDGGGKDGKRFLPGLIDVEALRRSGVNGGRSGSGRPPVGGRSAGGRGDENGVFPSDGAAKNASAAKNAHLDGGRQNGVVVMERRS